MLLSKVCTAHYALGVEPYMHLTYTINVILVSINLIVPAAPFTNCYISKGAVWVEILISSHFGFTFSSYMYNSISTVFEIKQLFCAPTGCRGTKDRAPGNFILYAGLYHV